MILNKLTRKMILNKFNRIFNKNLIKKVNFQKQKILTKYVNK